MKIVNTHQAEAWNGYEGTHWAENQERYEVMVGGRGGRNDVSLFEAAGIERDHHVLDIGCGNGQTTRTAARKATGGHVLGIDLSGPMLERARRTAVAEGIDNVSFEQGDAQVHDLPAARFDVAISRGGIMYFADPMAAFANIGAALKPGGRLVFGCGRDASDADFGAVWAAIGAHVALPDPAEDTAPGPATFTDPGRIREILTGAGFEGVVLREVESEMVLGENAADAVGFIFGWGPTRFWMSEADSASVGRAREEATAALRTLERGGFVVVKTSGWLVTATWR
ncbi:class I SAM-dependent methyltransferase [Saccharopolyspora shandongensis]|uniref:Ubiquinone/menaquinone biosynthesis C-methylase UbiE n=1 Tax=Saccharopolyspora shandongensis TaxID=418495 RepID=A0A1H3RP03_9PSEU|nr:class I SAM-dependent methyltransferase [Saccharopolyspora shandongensis]SDZ27360.1 Ubiquinone/menaquinone biosynthesis C-methylase UbiE [Saccharopolyspora shandongensis]